MRIAVTGGTGFLGGHLVTLLAQRGHEVLSMSRRGGEGRSCAAVAVDLEDAAAVARSLAGFRPEVVVHLAWCTQPGSYLTSRENLGWLRRSLGLLEAAAEAGTRRLVVAGSCAEYRPAPGWIGEDAPTEEATLYAACKLALLSAARRYAMDRGIGFAWGRFFNMYGAGENPRRLVADAIATLTEGKPFLASEGRQFRDFLAIEDAAAALAVLAEGDANGIFNVCSGEPLAIRDLLRRIANIVGRADLLRLGERPANPWDPPSVVGDPARLHHLGWRPLIGLDVGLSAQVRRRLSRP